MPAADMLERRTSPGLAPDEPAPASCAMLAALAAATSAAVTLDFRRGPRPGPAADEASMPGGRVAHTPPDCAGSVPEAPACAAAAAAAAPGSRPERLERLREGCALDGSMGGASTSSDAAGAFRATRTAAATPAALRLALRGAGPPPWAGAPAPVAPPAGAAAGCVPHAMAKLRESDGVPGATAGRGVSAEKGRAAEIGTPRVDWRRSKVGASGAGGWGAGGAAAL